MAELPEFIQQLDKGNGSEETKKKYIKVIMILITAVLISGIIFKVIFNTQININHKKICVFDGFVKYCE